MSEEVDVVVVGARCAGSPLAMLLARAGRSVTVVDRATFPSDRLSTHLLLHKGVHFLREWGLVGPLLAHGVPRVGVCRFNFGAWWIDLGQTPEPGDDAAPFLCAPRRTLLDALLVDEARRAGAIVREGETVRGVLFDEGRAVGVTLDSGESIRAALVVGADGLRSGVAAQVGAAELDRSAHTTCQVYAYWEGIEQDYMELGLRPGAAFGAFRCDGDLVLVSVSQPVDAWPELWKGGEAAYLDVLARWFPATRERIAGARRVTALRGTNDLPNLRRTASGPGWVLIGDAAMHKDPVTGLGISDAFHAASILAGHLVDHLDGGPAAVDAATRIAAEELRAATGPTFDIACTCGAYDFTEDQLPGLVMRMYDANTRDMAAVTGDPVESLIPS